MTLEQFQRLFEELRTETKWDVEGELLWGYYFSSPSSEKLSGLSDLMEESGYRVVGIFEDDENEGGFTLRVEEEEAHTPESLLARNLEFEAIAQRDEETLFQGLDVNSVSLDEDEDEAGDDDEEDDDEDDDDDFFDDEEDDGPVENPELIAAIEQLTAEGTTEAQDAVTNALLDAVFLIPTIPDGEGEANDEDDDEMIQLMVCVDEEEREFLPLFTDVNALRAWKDETVTVMELPAFEAWDFILAQASCSGAVINPETHSLAVTREQVEYLQSVTDLDELDEDEDEEEK